MYARYIIYSERQASLSVCIFNERVPLNSSLNNSELIHLHLQSLVEEQQSQLNQYECAAGQCVSELQKAQLQVQSLQAKIQESEANNMVLLLLPVSSLRTFDAFRRVWFSLMSNSACRSCRRS